MVWTIAWGIVLAVIILQVLPGIIAVAVAIVSAKEFWYFVGILVFLLIAISLFNNSNNSNNYIPTYSNNPYSYSIPSATSTPYPLTYTLPTVSTPEPTVDDNICPTGWNYDSGERISGSQVVTEGGGKALVTWNKLSRDVLYYTVDYGTHPCGFDFSTSAGSSSSIEIGGLPVGQRIYFRIKAGWHEPNSVWKEAYGSEVSVVVK